MEGGNRDIPSKNLCLTVPEKFRRGIVFCCIIFGYRKSLGRRGEEYPEFLSTLFCLTVPEKFRRGIL